MLVILTVTLDNTSGNSTLGDLVNAINNQAGGSVKASFSELTGGFKLNTVSYMVASTSLTIKTGTTASTFKYTKFLRYVNTTIDGKSSKWYKCKCNNYIPPGGVRSQVNYKQQSTNNFTIDGMNYSLSSTGATATVSVGSDTQKVYDKIKAFIDKYNTIVDDIQTKLTDKKDPNYKPLTDTQKSSMSASQITAWETKAKVGILRNDNNLQTMLNDLRTAFTTAVGNAGLSFGKYGSNSIGLDTSTDYTKPGHIDIVDPSKLKAAISSNSDQILKMFTNVSTATDVVQPYNSSTTTISGRWNFY